MTCVCQEKKQPLSERRLKKQIKNMLQIFFFTFFALEHTNTSSLNKLCSFYCALLDILVLKMNCLLYYKRETAQEKALACK